MAATVQTQVFLGAVPGAGSGLTNLRFKTADNNTQDTNEPCVKPTAGVNRSWVKTIALVALTAPDVGINNVKIYTDGDLPWTGCMIYVGDETPNTYRQATGSSDSGDEMTVVYAGLITAKTDFFTYTSGAPKAVSGSIGYTTGQISDLVGLQVDLSTLATHGIKPAENIVWQYDEI